MRQYFVEEDLSINSCISLSDEISHHIKDVLRMKNNDIIRIVDTNSHVYLGKITIGNPVSVTLFEELDINNIQKQVIFCAALIKKDKFELLLQKAAELGATTIVPLNTSRTVIKLEEKEINKKLDRWNKIVLEACQQSNRADLCHVERPVSIKNIDKYLTEINLVAYENETDNYALKLLDDKDVTFVIGPEGGLTIDEVNILKEKGFISCSLGNRILRAETAGMYMLTLIDAKRNML